MAVPSRLLRFFGCPFHPQGDPKTGQRRLLKLPASDSTRIDSTTRPRLEVCGPGGFARFRGDGLGPGLPLFDFPTVDLKEILGSRFLGDFDWPKVDLFFSWGGTLGSSLPWGSQKWRFGGSTF